MTVCSSTVTTRPVCSAAGHDAGHIERLDGGHMDDVGIDALRGQQVSGIDHAGCLGAGADERDVTSLAHHLDRTELELVAGLEERLGGVADQADEDRPVIVRPPRPGPALVSTSSAGEMTTMPGMARAMEMSSTIWWVLPALPVKRPV